MSSVNDNLDPEDYTDPHPATVVTQEDMDLADALRKIMDNKTCPSYLKAVAPAWLARFDQ